jgi:4-diphosphocytidyl-2-C-methyl-D-erythritol kinase
MSADPRPAVDPTRRLSPVVRLAPAKLNLSLAVVGRRADGYHELHSVMVPLELADRLSLASAAGRIDTLHVDGFDAGPEPANLVLRALAGAREAVGAGWAGGVGPPPALAVRLDKRIPVAAGLAGGSSDAAAALDGALEAWGADLTVHERLRVAARLGADVPFFLAAGVALVEGSGERVTPLRGILGEPPGVLVITPPVRLRTPDVFAAFDAGARSAGGATATSSNHLADELRTGLTAAALLDRAGVLAVANDLAPAAAALEPGLVALRRALIRRLGRPVGQSGSGPTLWVLYPSRAEAEAAAEQVRAAVADGTIPIPGVGDPFIAATAIAGRAVSDRSDR